MSNRAAIEVTSSKHTYQVDFEKNIFHRIEQLHQNEKNCFVVDANIIKLYRTRLPDGFDPLIIDANEPNKSLDKFPDYIEKLVDRNLKRDCTLIAIGGGITQDITCFIASTIFRGIGWSFIPTTLLAQADSCIGSKSSINVGAVKNLLGTFTPPSSIYLSQEFLKTLRSADILSGIGEMVKVHVIGGPREFENIKLKYDGLFELGEVMTFFVRNSLLLKKRLVELDEFDQGARNVMNYGHSFGHAIESATKFLIPHGVAVSIGMDMANLFSSRTDITPNSVFENMTVIMNKIFADFTKNVELNVESFFSAISKDKKNVGKKLSLILPTGEGAQVQKVLVENDDFFAAFCIDYFTRKGFKLS